MMNSQMKYDEPPEGRNVPVPEEEVKPRRNPKPQVAVVPSLEKSIDAPPPENYY